MKKFGFFLFTLIFCLLSSVSSVKSATTANCSIEVVTQTVEYNTPATIRIIGLTYDPNSTTNATFNIFSERTGKWVDIGDIVRSSNNEPFSVSLLNDNDGNLLFTPSANIGTTVKLRAAGLLGAQTDLCSSFPTQIYMLPDGQHIGAEICEDCVGFDDCKSGMICESLRCIPASSGQEGAGCMNDSQCDASKSLYCSGSQLVGDWCSTNPTSLPGVCTYVAPPEAKYNCANRGGQCTNGRSLDPSLCEDGVAQADCGGMGECWISPNDAQGTGASGAIGSCVRRPPDPGSLKDIGEDCSSNSECFSNSCQNGKCSALGTGQCIQVDHTVTPAFCENLNTNLCVRQRQNATDYFCCSSPTLCQDLGGEVKTNLPPMSLVVSGECLGGPGWVDTAIGCIPFDVISNTAKFFLAWGISIGGGVALLLVGVSGIMLATSSGNPDKVNSAKSLFWAAISGLLMLVLSVFLLRFIGVDVLGLFA